MKNLTKAVLVVAGLALAACSTNPGRYDNDGIVDLNAGAGNNAGIEEGSINDPRSPAYFQQAIGDRVLFAVDQSTLSDEAKITLNGQAEWLQTNTDYNAIIEGHADEQGTREYNLALGARRAASVYDYLISRGVPSGRIKTVSYGKERPIEICSEEACYSKNRRAVTVIAAGLSS